MQGACSLPEPLGRPPSRGPQPEALCPVRHQTRPLGRVASFHIRFTPIRGPSYTSQRGPRVAAGSGSGRGQLTSRRGTRAVEVIRRPAGTSPVGSEGVCGSLADGYHYSKDIRGSTEARNRLRV